MSTPSKSQPHASRSSIDWPFVRTTLGEVFERARLFHHPDAMLRQQATLFLMTVASGLREYALALPEDIKPIWELLRNDTQTLDMLLDVTGEVLLLTGYTVPELAAPYADAVHAAIPRINRNGTPTIPAETMSDTGFLESIAQPEELATLLAANPWLLTILLLKHTGHLSLLRSTVTVEPQPPRGE